MNDKLQEIAQLLEQRTAVIANHHLRDRDPDAHLDQLRSVSEALVAAHREVESSIDPRLNHFLTQCSYEKALEHIRGLLHKN